MTDPQDEGPDEVFSGHLKECLAHLKGRIDERWPTGSKGAEKARKPIAKFCGVSTHTTREWFRLKTEPIGQTRIKLMCYLDMIGYKVEELEDLRKDHRVSRNFMELIGFGLMSLEEAAILLGFSANGGKHLAQILKGKENTSEEKNNQMWEVWTARKDEIAARKVKARDQYKLNLPQKVRPKAEDTDTAETIVPSAPRKTSARTIERPGARRRKAIVGLMSSLLAFLQEEPFGDASLGELQGLDGPAEDTVFALFEHIGELSSRIIVANRKGG